MRRRGFVAAALATACLPGSRPPPRRQAAREDTDAAAPPSPAGADLEAAPVDPLDERVQALRATYEERGFTVLAQPPWVVIGDEAPDAVRRHAQGTIAWATARLRDAYFDRDPLETVEIWLLRDHASYVVHASEIFGDAPDTPYGYYTRENEALVMNIASGGGTLVHEMVHPLMRANFPTCPSWFDEGLASLYEQCGERDERIVGYTNWRLPGLQDAIEHGRLPPLRTLVATGDRGFYEDDPGSNYGQARYLCYWLQEHGKLREFYRAFAGAVDRDPSGAGALCHALGVDTLDAFDEPWQRWVLDLRYDG